ncbi:MAG: HAMP domain-containing protein [Alteromonadaceae bacterium]|nr:HAMP domain-containing protein [Alteromonadaceae bacterium]
MKIHNKLFLILFSFSLLLVSTLVFLVQWSIGKGMVEYVNTREIELLQPLVIELSEIYHFDGSWQIFHNNHRRFRRMLNLYLADTEFYDPLPKGDRPHRPPQHKNDRHPPERRAKPFKRKPPPPPPPPERERPPRKAAPRVSYAVLDEHKALVVGDYPLHLEYSFTEIVHEDKTVGYLAISKRDGLTKGYELDFIEQQQSYLWLMAICVMLLVVVVTFPLARNLVRPIRQLTQGMHNLTQGDFQQYIVSKRQDELGNLSRDFNELAVTLAQNESIRKRWLANISHELRTPIAILRGELEAMLDKVRPVSMKSIASANQEVLHLQRLVEDLHELTSADIGGLKYHKQQMDLKACFVREQARYQGYLADEGLELVMKLPEDPVLILADETRLCQLVENLLNNSIKYAGSGCKVSISLTSDPKSHQAQLCIEDNGVGVEKIHLNNLFEHLYRVDDSRNRETGGTGLGLSICAQIVKGHQGTISAKKSKLGGLAIIIKLTLVR